MKIAIIGSRSITIQDIGKYIPEGCTEIVSGGAKGIDTCAAEYAKQHNFKSTLFLPDYKKYGRAAPLLRNKQIIEYSDMIVALWDGNSRGTGNVINSCKKLNKNCKVYILK